MSRPGIHRIAVPTPFLVGDVNVYLIRDEPLTLVDTGPNLASSLQALEAGLRELGVRVEDLELIILTHQHTDHIGLVRVLQERSGATVAAWHELAGWLPAYAQSAAADEEYAALMMERHGVPDELRAALSATSQLTRALGSGTALKMPLYDRGVLQFAGRTLWVLHRPGHSPSDLILYDQEAGTVIGGDHLMASVASNAILTRPLTPPRDPGSRPRPLLDYRKSLRVTLGMPAGIEILPGHGPNVTQHQELIPERLRVQERRARKIQRTLASGPRTAHQLATELWGRMAMSQAPLMVSEVLGHIDLLAAEGLVVEVDDGRVTRFAAA